MSKNTDILVPWEENKEKQKTTIPKIYLKQHLQQHSEEERVIL